MAGPFHKIPMDPEKVPQALVSAGAKDVAMQELNNGKLRQYSGTFNEKTFLMKVFLNGQGHCTVGHSSGYDFPTFQTLAQKVVESCRYSEVSKLELSLPKQNPDVVAKLIESLTGLGGVVVEQVKVANHELTRIKGPKGDQLMVKCFSNGTLQLQGRHAQTAAWALDFLRGTMPLDDVLEQQRKVYALPITVQEIKDELVARIPNVHGKLADEVRIQLSSAHALTKVNIALEDYAAVAFPALRGLEGFCLQLLREDCNLKPVQNAKLGEYFQDAGPGRYTIRPPHSDSVAISLHQLLDECYTTWHKQRHRLFHMDGTLETTRILGDREEATNIVDEVFNLIDTGYADYIKTKP